MDHGDGVQRVVPTVSVRILDTSRGASAEAPETGVADVPASVADAPEAEAPAVAESAGSSGAAIEVPWMALRRPALRPTDLAFPVAVGAAVTLALSDVRLGVMSGLLIGLVEWMRSVDRRIPFSFGEGFLGYRSDLGWPHGVQEDDDVHWDWRPRRAVSQEDTDEVAGSRS